MTNEEKVNMLVSQITGSSTADFIHGFKQGALIGIEATDKEFKEKPKR